MAGDSTSFDDYADDYAKALDRGISLSGEDKEFFARGRIQAFRDALAGRGARTSSILDYGCGTGGATPYFRELFSPARFVGVDISSRSLEVARQRFGADGVSFKTLQDFVPAGDMDLAFCNGVFHHIPVPQRANCADYVFRALKPGGLFAFCENNPWNPGTHWVMARIPFDRDAVKVSIPGARRLLQGAGFRILSVTTLFYFPHFLSFLRPLERALKSWPLGAQYLMLAQKPDSP